MDETDSDLLVRTRNGDSEAFGEFYSRTEPGLFRWFRMRTASEHTAAELTAETFAEALRSIPNYEAARGTPTGWLYGIAHNQLRHWWRDQRVRRDARSALRIEVAAPSEDETDLVALRVDIESTVGSLTEALNELSQPVRDAVFARVVMQLSYGEVAERLDCSPGAARVRVSRGLAELQSHLIAVGVDDV